MLCVYDVFGVCDSFSKTMVRSGSPLPRYGHSLLEETRAENQQL